MNKKTMSMHIKKKEKIISKIKNSTHLFMNNKKIKEIGLLKITTNLKVIYLQNNLLKCITNLDPAINLTHLYLQHNEITKIENLHSLVNLVKLYLGYNKISVIEGLDNLVNLLELHTEYQHLNRGESLYFEPRTVNCLSKNLEYLNIAGNNIVSIKAIHGFYKLKTLIAKDNMIKDIEDVADTVNNLQHLIELSLQGNPVAQFYRYRENIIANSYQLKILDEKFVNDTSREFLKKFRHKKQLQFISKRSQTSLSDDITSSLNLPLSFRLSISRAIRDHHETNLSDSFKSTSIELHPPNSKSASVIKNMKHNHKLQHVCSKTSSTIKQGVQDDLLEQYAVVIPLLKK